MPFSLIGLGKQLPSLLAAQCALRFIHRGEKKKPKKTEIVEIHHMKQRRMRHEEPNSSGQKAL